MLALTALAPIMYAAGASATSTTPCAHADSISRDASGVATAQLSILSTPCLVSIQTIDKSGVGHGLISTSTSRTFTTSGPGSISGKLPCGVDSEADVIIGDPGLLYDPKNMDLLSQGFASYACPPPVSPPTTPPTSPPPSPPTSPPVPPENPPAPPSSPPTPPASPPVPPPSQPCPPAKPSVKIQRVTIFVPKWHTRWRTHVELRTRTVVKTHVVTRTKIIVKHKVHVIFKCPPGYRCMVPGQG